MLALLYVVSTLYAGRSQGRPAKNLATVLGCVTFALAAIFASANLYDFLIATDDIRVYVGKRQNWLWVIDPSESPFHYLLLVVSQVGTVIGSLVLGCSVYSHRHD